MQVFELPTMLAYPLFYKLVVQDEALVTREAMAAWVEEVGLLAMDPHTRMMEVLARKGASTVTQVPPPPSTPPSHFVIGAHSTVQQLPWCTLLHRRQLYFWRICRDKIPRVRRIHFPQTPARAAPPLTAYQWWPARTVGGLALYLNGASPQSSAGPVAARRD